MYFTRDNVWVLGKNPYHIETDPEVPPVQHTPRQVPVQLQQAYMEELDQLKK